MSYNRRNGSPIGSFSTMLLSRATVLNIVGPSVHCRTQRPLSDPASIVGPSVHCRTQRPLSDPASIVGPSVHCRTQRPLSDLSVHCRTPMSTCYPAPVETI